MSTSLLSCRTKYTGAKKTKIKKGGDRIHSTLEIVVHNTTVAAQKPTGHVQREPVEPPVKISDLEKIKSAWEGIKELYLSLS